MRLKQYYELTKPGMVYGNAIPVIGGFLLASGSAINWAVFLATLIGISLVVAAGCVFNNYYDRDIDAKMQRTKNRVFVTETISKRTVMVYGTELAVAGFLLLAVFTNIVAVAAAVVGLFFYLAVYTFWFKRHSIHGALVGAVAGATPPVVGYCAASGTFDATAVILFLILFIWQMPHFYAIAIRRLDDYKAANIPVMPAVAGIRSTKMQMLVYVVAFLFVSPMLAVFENAGMIYFVVSVLLSAGWLALCVKGFFISNQEDTIRWAKKMFFLSLIILVTLFATMSVVSFW